MSSGDSRNLGDLDKGAFKVDPDDKKIVYRRVCNESGDALLQQIIEELGGEPTTTNNTINQYNEVNAINSGISTDINTYTTISTGTVYLQNVHVSGCNISEYSIKINGTTIDKKLTYFGGSLNENFNYTDTTNKGYKLTAGDIVTVCVIHNRPNISDYNSRIQLLEVI